MPEPILSTATAGPPPLGDLLVERGLLGRADLERALALEREQGGGLARILADLGFVGSADLLEVQSDRLGIPCVGDGEFPAEPPAPARLPARFMRRHRFLPLGGSRVLRIAVADPLDPETLGNISGLAGKPVEMVLAAERDILAGIERFHGAVDEAPGPRESDDDVDRLRDMASEAPVIRFANALIVRGLEERASDIHLEPTDKGFRVRYRIDGLLERRPAPPAALRMAVVSRLKLMAGLDIAERRMPQDGRLQSRVAGREIDMRVATLPTLHGESLAIRLLDPDVAKAFDLASLGLDANLLPRVRRLADLSHGLVLATGPTGSGKSTTLHALLRHMQATARKIVTIEDPVEYRLEGVSQIQVNRAVGLTFATGLRHIVRQDPDVVMVGEIRDRETARIAIRAAMTGHSVYSTLHTNDAASAATRLRDMGVEQYLLASSLVAVLAQRLVRRLCDRCRAPAGSISAPSGRRVPTWRPKGCDRCRGQGYGGRIGIFELLEVDDEAGRILARGGTSRSLAEVCRRKGMRSLIEDGWDKVERGLTSADEVLRATEGASDATRPAK